MDKYTEATEANTKIIIESNQQLAKTLAEVHADLLEPHLTPTLPTSDRSYLKICNVRIAFLQYQVAQKQLRVSLDGSS